MTKVKTLLGGGGIFCVIALALLGCSRGFYFNDSRIPSSELPKVLLIDPAGGLKDAPVNAKICILFSDPMSLKTVAKSLHIRYGNITSAVKESAWSSFDDGRLFIYDDEDLILPVTTEITVTLDTSAADLDGYHIAKDVVWRFTTSLNSEADASPPSVNASTLVPTNDEVVNLDSSVSVEFTEEMLRGTVERSFLLQSSGGSVPDSRDYRSGRFVWDGRKMLYIPNEPLKIHDAQYRVSFNNNGIPCRDIAGNPYPDGTPVLSFYTISENVIYVSPSGSDTHEGTNKSRPKATISGAVQEAQEARARGDEFNVVKVAVGNYQDAVDLIDEIAIYGGYQPGFGSEVRTSGSRVFSLSSSAQAIRISGVNGCTVDKLEIHGPDGQQKALAVSIGGNSSDVTIQNCTIVGTDGAAIQESVGVSIDNSSDIRLRFNSISGGRGTISSTGVSATGDCSGITVTENLIEGGGNPLSNSSTGIDLINADAQVSRNVSIRGGNGARNVGVSISGNPNQPVIEANDLIQGGDAGEVIGIEVKGGAVPVIRDNKKITGGGTSSANANGILVNEQANPNIYRNLIIGGNITGGTGKAFGVQYDNSSLPPFYCNLFNNFILGGNQGSVPSVSCHGVYIRNTNLLIVNNTIDGGGHYDGTYIATASTFGIYALVDSSSWTINPRIINNYIIGGNSYSCFGIRLLFSSIQPLGCEIFNNIFNFTNLVSSSFYLGIGTDTSGVSSTGDVDQLNGPFGEAYISPAPKYNLKDTNTLNTNFIGWDSADYHISPSCFGTVANKGYSDIPAATPPETLQEILIDIDSQRRHIQNPDGTSNYSLVDLGADEVQ